MSTHDNTEPVTPAPAEPLRRRVIFELRLEELPLLQAAEKRHGTKRAALVRALAADGQCEALSAELAVAQARIGELEQALASERAQAASAAAAREKDKQQAAAALAKAQAALDKEQRAAKARSRTRAAEQNERERLQAELDELERLAVDELYCARCNTWVDPSAWAWKKDRDGSYAYHRPCGDHAPGLVGTSSWLAWRVR